MLQTQTVEPGTLSLLKELMQLPELSSCYLVGGTALSLLYGHRVSIDLDLFTTQQGDKTHIVESLTSAFGSSFEYRGNPKSFGLFCFINSVKVDIVSYPHPIISQPVEIDGIRMYHTDDIVAMKVNAILGRGRKKDFWDLAELCKQYSVVNMIELYKKKFPSQQLLISIPQALTYFDDADNDLDPQGLKNQSWESIKAILKNAVREFLT
jgi:predicted nucleotidyltransferase component of viral defense system